MGLRPKMLDLSYLHDIWILAFIKFPLTIFDSDLEILRICKMRKVGDRYVSSRNVKFSISRFP